MTKPSTPQGVYARYPPTSVASWCVFPFQITWCDKTVNTTLTALAKDFQNGEVDDQQRPHLYGAHLVISLLPEQQLKIGVCTPVSTPISVASRCVFPFQIRLAALRIYILQSDLLRSGSNLIMRSPERLAALRMPSLYETSRRLAAICCAPDPISS